MENVLEVKNLKISFQTFFGEVEAVRGITFSVGKKETLAIVGESGCGKSVTANGIMQLLPKPPAFFKGGEILFNGEDLLKKTEKQMQAIRGNKISMVFQDPMTSLNPTMKIGYQIVEGLVKHNKMSREEAKKKSIEMLEWLIRTYTNENDVILDNTMGSCTCGIASLKTNRQFIGIEKEKQYYDVAVRRLSEYCG